MSVGQLRSSDKFRPWLIGIARNLCFDHLRRNKREKTSARTQNNTVHGIPAKYRGIHEAIARLPEKYRVPLLMYYFDGRSSDSVAEALNLSRDGVLTRLSRGRRELRRIITSWENGSEG
jgi:RNA polymerase sigma-70 factor (ECF subfamily)